MPSSASTTLDRFTAPDCQTYSMAGTRRVPFEIDALDDFAGTGWGVACQRLGIRERGVELMPEAVATRTANGMVTIGRDVWEHIAQQLAAQGTDAYYRYELYIGSPPCQTFSMAGGGKGRQALDEVIALIDSRLYLDADALRAFGEEHDPRTALVLAPLVRVAHDLPLYVVLEQVPPVLPVWERYAEELRKWGYSVWCGILNSEQYGVPQTRKRAVLIARADGIEAAPPTPTHSRYYSHDPKRLDPGVLPWVSMAEALQWGMTARPSMTVTGGGGHGSTEHPRGGAEPFARGSREGIEREREAGRWLVSNYTGGGNNGVAKEGNKLPRGKREADQPASTMTSKAGHMVFVNGNQPNAARRPEDTPAPTIHFGAKPNERQRRDAGLPAPSVTSGSRSALWEERPATTVAGDSRIWPPGHKVNGDDIARLGEDEARARYGDRAGTHSTKVTVEEAAALQSYPEGFNWSPMVPVVRNGVDTGKLAPLSKTKAFLQIGNAVPPTLAEAILSVFLPDDTPGT